MKFPSNAWLNTRVQFVSFKILKMFKKEGGAVRHCLQSAFEEKNLLHCKKNMCVINGGLMQINNHQLFIFLPIRNIPILGQPPWMKTMEEKGWTTLLSRISEPLSEARCKWLSLQLTYYAAVWLSIFEANSFLPSKRSIWWY